MTKHFFESDYELILGSQSPRRKALLEQLGYQFTQQSLNVDESFPESLMANEVAEFLAVKKANAFQKQLKENQLLITSDTVVVLGNSILEKAANADEAKHMLRALSGSTHDVISAVCLSSENKQISFSVTTKVWFKKLEESEIDFYIAEYRPFDKAGAYGIQEWIGLIGVEKIEGSFYNVMGLPVKELYEALRTF